MHATTPNPVDPADPAHRAMLDSIARAGVALIHDLTAEDAPATTKAEPFERLARAVRRTIVLARHIAEHPLRPGQAATHAAQAATAARKRIVREIDDAIELRAGRGPRAETLRRELRERIDDVALDLDIVHRPLDQIIAEIRRDLGLDDNYGARPWPRRTPDQIRALNEIAERTAPPPPPPNPQTQHHDDEPEPQHPEDTDPELEDPELQDPASLLATILRRPRPNARPRPRIVRDG